MRTSAAPTRHLAGGKHILSTSPPLSTGARVAPGVPPARKTMLAVILTHGPLSIQGLFSGESGLLSRQIASPGPDFPGLTRRVTGPVRLRFAAPWCATGRGARVTDKTDKTVMGWWPPCTM